MAKMEVLRLTQANEASYIATCANGIFRPSVAQRMRIVLLLDGGASYREIEERLGAFPATISRWKQR